MRVKSIFTVLLLLQLTACGGSEGDSTPTNPSPVKQPQTIVFAQSDVVKAVGDEAFVVELTDGRGSGKVSYSSSDPAIAEVNADTGEVSVKAFGEVTIQAQKAADEAYLATSSSYQVRVKRRRLATKLLGLTVKSLPIFIGEKAQFDLALPDILVDGSDVYRFCYYYQSNPPENPSDQCIAIQFAQTAPSVLAVKGGSHYEDIAYEDPIPEYPYFIRFEGKAVGTAELHVSFSNNGEYLLEPFTLKADVMEGDEELHVADLKDKVMRMGDAPFSIVAHGGHGAISYLSSDPSVAQVDALTGRVTLVSPGETQISIVSGQSLGEQAEFRLVVLQQDGQPANPERLVVWRGANSSEIHLEPATANRSYTITNDILCRPDKGDGCPVVAQGVVGSSPHSVNLPLEQLLSIRLGANPTPLRFDYSTQPTYSDRDRIAVLLHNDNIYLLGGESGGLTNQQPLREVWVSAFGQAWQRLTDLPDYHNSVLSGDVVSYQGKLLVASYLDGEGVRLSSSSDGQEWTKIVPQGIDEVFDKGFVSIRVFNGRLFMYVGEEWQENNSLESSLYYESKDAGQSWYKTDGNIRGIFEGTSFQQRWYKVTDGKLSSTEDGVNWRWESEEQICPRIKYNLRARLFTYQNRLWANCYTHGFDGGYPIVVVKYWEQGDQWRNIDYRPEFKGDFISNNLLEHNGRLLDVNRQYPAVWGVFTSSHVFSSVDARHWQPYKENGQDVNLKSIVVWKGVMYMAQNAALYRSSDGLFWQYLVQLPSSVSEASLTQFKDKLWLIGLGKVWSTENGHDWQLAADGQVFGHGDIYSPEVPFNATKIVATNNTLYMFSRYLYGNDKKLNQVLFYSHDGIVWERGVSGFAAVGSENMVAIGDRIWWRDNRKLKYSDNGQEWVLMRTDAPYGDILNYRGKLLLGNLLYNEETNSFASIDLQQPANDYGHYKVISIGDSVYYFSYSTTGRDGMIVFKVPGLGKPVMEGKVFILPENSQ